MQVKEVIQNNMMKIMVNGIKWELKEIDNFYPCSDNVRRILN